MRVAKPKKHCNKCGKEIDNRNKKGLCLKCFTAEQALILTVKHYCICGTETSKKGVLCKACAYKELGAKMHGSDNPNFKHGLYTKKGE